jgi:tRNA(fMet)-specific endonuclease VapC
MELRFGAARRPDVVAFWRRLEREVLARVRIETFDDQAALRAGDILAVLEGKGTPIGIEDALIGATALARGLTVVTANTRHFKRIPGLVVEDWTRD